MIPRRGMSPVRYTAKFRCAPHTAHVRLSCMALKRALIVDDSRSARLFLARILEKHDIEVDSVESAEAAIGYLASRRPDVIFMDHMMPGMDGFQAVQAIKNDPRTATIPIMMYTSQEGEVYLGQARALGAIGVLPKQIKPADVSKVLYQLHLIVDRRQRGANDLSAAGGAHTVHGEARLRSRRGAAAAAACVPGTCRHHQRRLGVGGFSAAIATLAAGQPRGADRPPHGRDPRTAGARAARGARLDMACGSRCAGVCRGSARGRLLVERSQASCGRLARS